MPPVRTRMLRIMAGTFEVLVDGERGVTLRFTSTPEVARDRKDKAAVPQRHTGGAYDDNQQIASHHKEAIRRLLTKIGEL